MMDGKAFAGPLFIVGRPRSGTKLLRDLLNEHSQVAITVNESHFIPYYYHEIHKFGDLRKRENFERFYNELSKITFIRRLKKKNKSVSPDLWHESVEDWSYAGIVEAFYRAYARREGKIIWGDKTPSYLTQLPLLYALFPTAKVIHIIRDARDYCISINKAWGKNMYRAAQQWVDQVAKCRKDGAPHSGDGYHEMKYEALLDHPKETIGQLCEFIGIEFEEDMLRLNVPSENLGDTKGATVIVKGNHGKWKNSLEPAQVQRIERICGPLMRQLGYPVSYEGDAAPPHRLLMGLYKLSDGFNLMRFEYAEEKRLLAVLKGLLLAQKIKG